MTSFNFQPGDLLRIQNNLWIYPTIGDNGDVINPKTWRRRALPVSTFGINIAITKVRGRSQIALSYVVMPDKVGWIETHNVKAFEGVT